MESLREHGAAARGTRLAEIPRPSQLAVRFKERIGPSRLIRLAAQHQEPRR